MDVHDQAGARNNSFPATGGRPPPLIQELKRIIPDRASRFAVARRSPTGAAIVGCAADRREVDARRYIPGCQGVEVVSPTHYKARIRVQVGPIKAEFNLDVEIISETAPEEVRSRTRREEGSRASSLSAENTLRLTALSDNETEVCYASVAAIVGRLGKFGLGVMKKLKASAATLSQHSKKASSKRRMAVKPKNIGRMC